LLSPLVLSTFSYYFLCLDSTSELSASIQFIESVEKSSAFQITSKESKRVSERDIQFDPMMTNIKEELGDIIFQKHLLEFIEHSYYSISVIENYQEEPGFQSSNFRVIRDRTVNQNGGRIVKLSENFVQCSCNLFERGGILCRHVFIVNLGIKDLTKYLHVRWRLKF